MFFIQNPIFFKFLSGNKPGGYEDDPYYQEGECEQDGEYLFGPGRPWIVTENIKPKKTSGGSEDNKRNYHRNKKTRYPEQK
jgi:hypothetical protein